MTQRRLIDTNLIVRHLVQDHERHAKLASKLFAACDRGDIVLVILPVVLAECVFVLESFYKQPRANIAQALKCLIGSPGIELGDLPIYLDALTRYARTQLHIVDCMIAATAASQGIPVATFDQDFKKLHDVVVDVD